ncbi:VOC family protein [Sinomonas notoginsengisoli]|uniref:VOC family protein n=1 Tax=Sinomonas notoginsengisoli TaxID=1457311 RepID=UPI001F1F5516|nr:VOC family protein [Sinomonas notoginsengisoli]
MPTPDLTPGAPCWVDLLTTDLEKAKEFYSELFGWTYETGDQEMYGGYTTAFRDGRMVAGLMGKMEEQAAAPDAWTVYFKTDDINATASAVSAAGGQVYMPPMEVPEQGHMAVFGDSDGAAFGSWQAAEHTGFLAVAEPGTPAWFELHARDYDSAVAFYAKALGWDLAVMGDTTDFRYSTYGEGPESKAGIFDAANDLPDGVPPHWLVYWAVEDADQTVEKATALGAEVVLPAVDTPFGRMAQLADPWGAPFRITQDLGQGGEQAGQ